MSGGFLPSVALLALLPAVSAAVVAEAPVPQVVLAIHGGTGEPKQDVPAELQQALRTDMQRALEAGYAQLRKPGGTGLDGVEAAIRVLEDSPHFNAGKGAVFTHDGRNELDASIMEGAKLRAGAVAGVTVIKNPITAARAVMEMSKHVLLIGPGAEEFATKAGLEIVEPSYFWTERRWQQIQKILKKEAEAKAESGKQGQQFAAPPETWGTVGAVAVDQAGNLAAGTSTGGMTNKMHGRVGDSPIIGAGTYADNQGCAVSATGHGEYFIRYAVAHDISSLVKYKNLSVLAAAEEVVQRKLKPAGGEGGVIVLDAKGNFAAQHNTDALYRGYITRDGKITITLYDE